MSTVEMIQLCEKRQMAKLRHVYRWLEDRPIWKAVVVAEPFYRRQEDDRIATVDIENAW